MPHDPPHDPPTEDVLDAPLVGVKLNVQWWSHVIGLASVAARQSYWASDQERGEESMEQLLDLLAKGNLPVFDPLSVRVRRSTTQTIPHNVITSVIFDVADHDVGDLWDIASPAIIQITEPGLWIIGAGTNWTANVVGTRGSEIRVPTGDRIVREQGPAHAANYIFPIGTVWEFAAATTVELTVIQTSGANLALKALNKLATVLYAHYLGPI